MSREFHVLFKERAQIGVLGWPLGLSVSLGFHILIVAAIFISPESIPNIAQEKIRWVTLPAAGGGVAGGSAPTEHGETRGRQRRVEEVAPALPTPKPVEPVRQNVPETPKLTETPTPPKPKPAPQQPKGTNPNPASRGTSPTVAKGESPVKTVVPGAAGSGSTGGVGQGAGIPGLKPTQGIMGGTGLLQEFIGANDFPLWYAQRVQDGVTKNWVQLRGSEGRVQIFFRILRNGRIETARVEISSGKRDLDEMALQAVRRTTLPSLPEEFEGDTLGVRFWFNYTN